MPGFDGLVDDVIAQAAMDQEEQREEHSERLARLRGRLIGQMEQLERQVADAERKPGKTGQVQPVRGRPDPADPVGGADLPDMRRMASDLGAAPADHATPCHIMNSGAQLAVPNGVIIDAYGSDYVVFAFWFWACGPCGAQGAHATAQEQQAAISAHLETRR